MLLLLVQMLLNGSAVVDDDRLLGHAYGGQLGLLLLLRWLVVAGDHVIVDIVVEWLGEVEFERHIAGHVVVAAIDDDNGSPRLRQQQVTWRSVYCLWLRW